MPEWLKDAVFYEIYPQSFYDTNGDGIGDLKGIMEKLDYIRNLGCNALWINPCFDSPFKDAGYDVRDYKKIAPRYGTNKDMEDLFAKAHEKGIRVLLDLVPGHTSEEHEWFKQSGLAEKNEYSGRYIWTNGVFQGIPGKLYISGECERDGVYLLNFFKCQPALNYGWGKITEDWQSAPDAPECRQTIEAIKDVMRFWLDLGCDGFRVDMADSLVKDDDERKSFTSAIWKEIRSMLDQEYPEAAMVSEWSNPDLALHAGFHMDFYLDHHYNGYNTLMRDYETPGGDHSYFKKDAGGDITRFLDDYLPKYEKTVNDGYISFFTCNHDTPRPRNNLAYNELKLAYAFIFTMPGVPFLYYGDEIGMRYLPLKTKEGGYARTGSRSPMQWYKTENYGFSTAREDQLYLPYDPAADAPDAASQISDPDSLWNTVKEVIALRHAEQSLQADAPFEVIYAKKQDPLFIYRRGDLVCMVNPSSQVKELPADYTKHEVLFSIGDGFDLQRNRLEGSSFAVLRAL